MGKIVRVVLIVPWVTLRWSGRGRRGGTVESDRDLVEPYQSPTFSKLAPNDWTKYPSELRRDMNLKVYSPLPTSYFLVPARSIPLWCKLFKPTSQEEVNVKDIRILSHHATVNLRRYSDRVLLDAVLRQMATALAILDILNPCFFHILHS